MSELALPQQAIRCDGCATELAPALLICPSCRSLVHRARLQSLARTAEAASDPHAALAAWREALALLPAGTRQYDTVVSRIDALTAAIEGKTLEEMRKGPSAGSKWAKILGPLGVAGLLLWKLKFLVVALLTKGKLLLLGLTKMSTVASFFLTLGVYWSAWGWKLAAALLGGIYIHEMGHVAELRRRGIAASAPMFIPGLGAVVRLGQHAATPSEDAKIGLAGPLWGFGAGCLFLTLAVTLDSKFWYVVTYLTAVINLFNLTPVWELDGSRGFHALSRTQRWIIIATIALVWLFTREGMLVLVGLVAVWRAFEKKITTVPDWNAFATFVFLIGALAALTLVPR
ncbi:MAG: site-2 protease family protein [Thermoanaerobaculia bacterium]